MNDKSDLMILRKEVFGLFEHIQRIRREIASIHRPGQTSDRFTSMSDELDAIVASTESATNTIMGAAENLDAITNAVNGKVDDPAIKAELDKAPDLVGQIFEACSFQDITGQRITKVVTSLQFIESRVHNLITMWGENAIADQSVDDDETEEKDEYKQYLNGPALAGEGISQADVDAMLNGGPPPKPKTKPAPGTVPQVSRAKPVAKTKAASKAKPTPAPVGAGLGQDDIDKLFD
ncbi:MAG: protein phosphatase CheZ [Rhodospirillum sp.]|nr:protein phosphatase CheZ [Rhodospirillum sp.]MCF8488000.1 protein phosphatase CheZ [Rhodospirillum sp.]MCF8500475.1 protein phosphatase CheZ [Rhodospirillum sp.]